VALLKLRKIVVWLHNCIGHGGLLLDMVKRHGFTLGIGLLKMGLLSAGVLDTGLPHLADFVSYNWDIRAMLCTCEVAKVCGKSLSDHQSAVSLHRLSWIGQSSAHTLWLGYADFGGWRISFWMLLHCNSQCCVHTA